MTDTITLPRSVVEQTIEAMRRSGEQRGSTATEFNAIEALRAALEQQHVSVHDELPFGFVPLQREKGSVVYAACLDGGRFNGWLMWRHPDGQWVSKRKLEQWELMQVEDQRDYDIVQGD